MFNTTPGAAARHPTNPGPTSAAAGGDGGWFAHGGEWTNTFGATVVTRVDESTRMATTDLLAETDAPADRPRETIDARELPTPEPLRQTLERLADLDDDLLVQLNDRAPQHLYPKLTDRGYEYATVETEDAVVTAVWRE